MQAARTYTQILGNIINNNNEEWKTYKKVPFFYCIFRSFSVYVLCPKIMLSVVLHSHQYSFVFIELIQIEERVFNKRRDELVFSIALNRPKRYIGVSNVRRPKKNCISNERTAIQNNIKMCVCIYFKRNQSSRRRCDFFVSIFWLIPIHHPRSKLQFMKCTNSHRYRRRLKSTCIDVRIHCGIENELELAICFFKDFAKGPLKIWNEQ